MNTGLKKLFLAYSNPCFIVSSDIIERSLLSSLLVQVLTAELDNKK